MSGVLGGKNMLTKEGALKLKEEFEAEFNKIEEKLSIEDAKDEAAVNEAEYNRLEAIESKINQKLFNLETIIEAYEDIEDASAKLLANN